MKTQNPNLRIPLQAMFALFFATSSLKAYADDLLVAKQFVNGTTIAIARIDSKRIGLPDELMQKMDSDAQLKKLAKPVTLILKNLANALNGEPVYVAVDIPYSSDVSPVRLYFRNSLNVNSQIVASQLAGFPFTKPVVQGDFLCMSFAQASDLPNKMAIENDILPVARPEFDTAAKEVVDFPIQILILPPDYLRTTFRELLPTLPAKFGGGPTSILTDGVKWTALGVDPSKLKLHAVTQSSSQDAAKTLASHLPEWLFSQKDSIPMVRYGIVHLLPLFSPTVSGDKLTVSIQGDTQMANVVAFASNAIGQLLGSMTTQIKMDRFKQIGLAIHNYESAFKILPPRIEGRDEKGKSYLSWRVHILPFLGQVELYNQFRLKEPWDSEHNLKLLEGMPDVYKGGMTGMGTFGETKPGYTTFLAPVGEGTIFGGLKPCKFADITDGTSNTIWLVDVKAEFAKPWTAPDEYAFDTTNPALGLAEIQGDKPSFLCGWVDGSVRQLPLSLPAETILHLFQMNDGNVVDLP